MVRGTLLLVATLLILVAPPAEQPRFHKELVQAAADYFAWARVDDEMHWAPHLCRSPRVGRAYESESGDETTHGRKLYSLFAKDRKSYIEHAERKQSPVGQVIVKQSWTPEEVTGELAEEVKKNDKYPAFHHLNGLVLTTPRDPAKATGAPASDHFFPYAVKGGKVYKAAKPADLFIMLKLDPHTQDTDAGWVYGTVSPDKKTVHAAGRIASCMKCHAEAKHDRLFGWRREK